MNRKLSKPLAVLLCRVMLLASCAAPYSAHSGGGTAESRTPPQQQGETLSLDFQDVDVRNALQFIAK